MSKPIGVLFVATEADPFVKTGSVALLAGNLPKLVRAMGHDIRVMLPGYGFISTRRFPIHNLLRMRDIEIPIGDSKEHAYIRSSYLCGEHHKVQVYFLANDRYFNREGLYYHPETKKYFPDNDERFIFFCRGVLETLKRLQWQPKIIHCNDWQCGLIPMYLKTIYKDDPFFKNTRTVFTAYNLASHGIFPQSAIAKIGLPPDLFKENGNSSGHINFLKLGMYYADLVTTFGNRVEKCISSEAFEELQKSFGAKKKQFMSMTNDIHNNIGQEQLAANFVDVYRNLIRNS